MEADGKIIHVYLTPAGKFGSSKELVQHAIDTSTPLKAVCGDVWMPTSTEYLYGDNCPECESRMPNAYKLNSNKNKEEDVDAT